MSTTPKINNFATIFGGPISKRLLTPCRRVGLSRNRKSPKNILKLPSKISNNSNDNVVGSSLSVSTKKTLNKSPKNTNSSNSVKTNLDESPNTLKDIIIDSHSHGTKVNKGKISQVQTENTCTATARKPKSTIEKTSDIAIIPITSVDPSSLKQTKSNVPYDSDENLPPNRNKKKLKRTKPGRFLAKKTGPEETMTRASSDKMVESSKNVKITLPKLSEDETINVDALPENESSDEEVIAKVKKKKIKMISDDEDSCRGSQTSLYIPSDDFIKGSVKTTEIPEATPSHIENTPSISVVKSETIKPINPKKSNVSYDSDEDFVPSERIKPTLKRTKSEGPLAKKARPDKSITKTRSENMVDSLKNCRITLRKLTEDEIISFETRDVNAKPEKLSCDEEVIAKSKKKKIKMSDDEDSCRSPKSDDFVKGSVEANEIPEACKESEKNVCKKSSLADILEDEADAFTSTPDKDKNEKRYLIEKNKILENQIHEKKKKLENLKEAAVHKTSHNIEDLGKLTEKYREACVKGLRELLSQLQLQAHTPIDMPTLLHNLNIPGEMVTKLAFNEEL